MEFKVICPVLGEKPEDCRHISAITPRGAVYEYCANRQACAPGFATVIAGKQVQMLDKSGNVTKFTVGVLEVKPEFFFKEESQ